MSDQHLLSDAEVARFIVDGYRVCELPLPPALNRTIAAKLDALARNPGDALTDEVPELLQVLDHPVLTGALTSLLGLDYRVALHRHWHCKRAGAGHMNWHQDGLNSRDPRLRRMLGLYYPTDVTAEMGPTIIVPGTHFRNAPTDRMQTYANISGQVPLIVKAGTIALTHYDLWHGTAANRSPHDRHMVKFLFNRTQDNEAPTWNHRDAGGPLDWNGRDGNQDPANILAFSNPLRTGQSDHYKERHLRRQCWQNLLGTQP